MIIVKNKKSSIEKLKSDYPGAIIIDVTSQARDQFIRFSPFYPHGGIPVPFSQGWHAMSVESGNRHISFQEYNNAEPQTHSAAFRGNQRTQKRRWRK